MGARADVKVFLECRDAKVPEEDLGPHRVVVLSGLDDDVFYARCHHGFVDWGGLLRFGVGPDNEEY